MSLSVAFLAAACSDSDAVPSDGAGAGKGGGGAGGSSAGAGRGGSSGASAGAGEAAGEGGALSGEGGDSSAGATDGGSAGDDGTAGQGGAPGSEVCLPDNTTLQVTATGTSAYIFAGLPTAWSDGAGDHNAPLRLCRGYTYTFALSVAGHPFYFKTAQVTGTGSAYDTGVTSNGLTTGNLEFVVPANAPAALFYQCSNHTPMTGTVTIVDAG